MASAVHSSPISVMGTENAPEKMTLMRPSEPSTTATLLNVPISPVKTLSLETLPDAHKSASTIVSPADSFFAASTVVSPTDSFYVEFQRGDPRNPINYSWLRKWCITLVVCAFNGITSPATPSFAMGYGSMIQDLNCTRFQATVAYCLYSLGFGIVPLFTSSLSEEVGRRPIYLVSAFLGAMCNVLAALSNNIQTIMVARVLGGAFASTGAILVGGTIADIWEPHERGLPMAVFSMVSMVTTGLGSIISAWLELDPHLQWRWIQRIQAIVQGTYFLLSLLIMEETRSQIILRHIAKKLCKETGDDRYRARGEETRPKLSTMIKISCTRPIMFVLTEPIVTSICIWVFFMSGVLYVQIGSVSGVFKHTYHFNVGQSGLVFITVIVGSILGLCANFYQDVLYRKYVSQRGPEARLYIACLVALLLPTSIFIYAWTAEPTIFWMWPVVVFIYLADCYGPMASSALAGQGLARNLGSFGFPLFSHTMFKKLTYKWANTIFGGVAVILIPVPFVLFFYGPSLRKYSTVCSQLMQVEEKPEIESRDGEP
ncbi:major facilitator superfamily domain-containing protein [Suillus subaureus]|uniref:Major facilitator superfamily domain-containing protein n=1 Tax=Suillus subaureus TaxID=48587 RepID=A0A9P7EBP1_9AGAM|nr:major facilitator superfamily domain-containing protein [Suillus subaureus]KAG1817078.1 major facilitator superfamily domain-containing protein [Suillus subaureus]